MSDEVVSIIIAIPVNINNMLEPSNAPGPLEPILNVLPASDSGSGIALTVGLILLAIIASVIHTKAKQAIAKS